MYADDVMFVGDWSPVNFLNLKRLLRCFSLTSGLRVNFSKSKVFGVGVGKEEMGRLANFMGCEASEFPFTYLGLPIGANMKLAKNWNPVIERFKCKLNCWKKNTLSFGGRLTLVNSVLGSLPLYYMSVYKAPSKVIDKLEMIRRRFLWKGTVEKRCINWVAWDKVTTPKHMGGLGVKDLKDFNNSLLAKWWWKLRKESSALWSKVIKSIHRIKEIDDGKLAKKKITMALGKWLLRLNHSSWSLVSVLEICSEERLGKVTKLGSGKTFGQVAFL